MSGIMAAPMRAALETLRSLLFVPANDQRKLAGAAARGADAVIVDLEDAVAADEKAGARATAASALAAMPAGPLRMLRVNAAGSAFHGGDVALLDGLELDAVVLPKATPAGLAAVGASGVPVLALVETAEGLRGSHEIASHPAVFALMLGAADLAADLGLTPREDGLEILHARSKLVLDSRAAKIRAPFDGVHLALDDADGLLARARLARTLGMRGMGCIHPAQIAIVHAAFAPQESELAWARRVIAAAGCDSGARALDGMLVDAAILARARAILAEVGD
jgi:citrate lyase beta subunit